MDTAEVRLLQTTVPTFDQVAQEILIFQKLRCRSRTCKVSIAPVNHLLKTFSGIPVSKIHPQDFYRMHVKRARIENPRRNLNNDRKLFIQIMRSAYGDGHTRYPPINIPMPDHPKNVGKELSGDEIARILRFSGPRLRFQIEILLKTGMRLREMLGLKWRWIDLERGIISLPASLVKTHRGRSFPIANSLRLRFIEVKKRSLSPYVFPSRYSRDLPQTENKSAWNRAKRLARVKAREHDLRHTSATIKIRAGNSESVVSREMGMSEQVLRRIYNHVHIEDMRDSAEAVNIPMVG